MLDGTVNDVNIGFDQNFDLNKSLNNEEYKDFIFFNIENILKKRFKEDSQKQKIVLHKDRISFSCPICGDSMQNSWKQRGNIILEGKHRNHYKCFNCGVFKKVDDFLKDFNVDVGLDVINYINQFKSDFTYSGFAKYDISLLMDLDIIEKYAINREDLKTKFSLVEVKGSPVWSWLNKRLQFEEKKFLYSPLKNYVLILNLTPKGGIIGFQKRNFGKFQTKYLTFNLPTIYAMLGKTEKIPDDIDSLSQLFGILFLDFRKSITLFEGPFDSFLFKNSVANGGANKGFPIELPLKYFYDDDKTGRKKALEKINDGNQVFLWSKFKNEYGLPQKPKWDLTDVLIYFKSNNINTPYWDNYFSKDSMDAIDI
jgi:hypothetical protein